MNARGVAYAEHDRDGDLDMIVTAHHRRAMLLRNDGGNHNFEIRLAFHKLCAAECLAIRTESAPTSGHRVRKASSSVGIKNSSHFCDVGRRSHMGICADKLTEWR